MTFAWAATLPESRLFINGMVGRSLAAASLKHEAAAAMMGIRGNQLSAQLAGVEHLSVQRLFLINEPKFWQHFVIELRDHFALQGDLSENVEQALGALLISVSKAAQEVRQLRMARADVSSPEERKRA